MQIGNIQDFMAGQAGKVQKRKEEEKRIKKGIYQMQVMLDSQEMEILDKERKRSESRTENTPKEEKDTKQQGTKQLDLDAEREKMMVGYARQGKGSL